jgi:hypothetical protein
MNNDFDDLDPSTEDGLILAFFSCADELDAMIAETSPSLADPVTFLTFRDALCDYMIAQVNLVSFEHRNTLTADEAAAICRASSKRYVAAWKRLLAETDLIDGDPTTVKLQKFVMQQAGLLG